MSDTQSQTAPLKNAALLVIDVQKQMFDEEPRAFEADAVIERINTLTAQARMAQTPVVFIQHEAVGELDYDSDAWQLPATLHVEPTDLKIRKTMNDSFRHTNLSELLKEQGIERLVICGYATDFCVDTTVRAAGDLGFPVVLVTDAHTTHDKSHASGALIRAHLNATLHYIDSYYPNITPLPTSDIRFADSGRIK